MPSGPASIELTPIPHLEREVDGKPAWERLKNERMIAFGAFQTYRDLPMHSRTMPAVLKVISDEQAGGEGARILPESNRRTISHLKRWYREYAWEQRVEYFDEFMDKHRIQESKNEASEMIKRHIGLSAMLQAKGAQALRQVDAERLQPKEILSYLMEGAKLERMARGEPTEITETKGTIKGSDRDDEDSAVRSAKDVLKQRLNAIAVRNKELEEREAERKDMQEKRQEAATLRLA